MRSFSPAWKHAKRSDTPHFSTGARFATLRVQKCTWMIVHETKFTGFSCAQSTAWRPRRKGLFNQTTSHLSCYTGMVSYQKFPFDKHIPRADTAKPPYRIANMSHLAAGSGGSSGSSSTQRDMLPIARETKIIRFFFPICFLNSNACEALWRPHVTPTIPCVQRVTCHLTSCSRGRCV